MWEGMLRVCNDKPEMIISCNCPVATIAKILSTICTNHLVATFSF